MSLNENGNGGMVMPVGPMYGNANGFGNFGDGGLFWIIILFLFAWMGNGWGGGFGGQAPVVNMNNDVQRGFDQNAIMSGLNNLNNGLANAELSRSNLAMSLQNCCCENRAGLADLKYTVATEACADRNAISNALMSLETSLSNKTQMVLDKLCQQEIDALKTQNANLQTQINLANLKASQSDQTAAVLADNANQTAILRQALNPTPIPAYVVQNPNGCGCCQNIGCGC